MTTTIPAGWTIQRQGDEIKIVAPNCDPGCTYVTNGGRLERRLLFALTEALLKREAGADGVDASVSPSAGEPSQ
jgi:hypothetical protein